MAFYGPREYGDSKLIRFTFATLDGNFKGFSIDKDNVKRLDQSRHSFLHARHRRADRNWVARSSAMTAGRIATFAAVRNRPQSRLSRQRSSAVRHTNVDIVLGRSAATRSRTD